MENNLEQLKKLAKVFNTDNVITSAEVEQVLKGIMQIMASFKKDNEALTSETKQVVNTLLNKVIAENEKLHSSVSHETSTYKDEMISKMDSSIKEMKKMCEDLMLSKPLDGQDADEEVIVDKVLERLPKIDLDNATQLRDKLETLKGDERLDIKFIKGLEDLFKKGKGKTTQMLAGGARFINQLFDVKLTSLTDNDVLSWDAASGKWVNEAASSGSGTVTSVAALTLGTSGTDLSSTVATGTTTPVITLQVPTASATKRGALSSTDWSTFNSKAPALGADDNYVTDAQLVVLGNTSGTNTGDQTNISGNAATVTTNANLTGPVTSVGNATAIADSALSIAKTSGLQTALDAKELLSNKATDFTTINDTLYPSVQAVNNAINTAVVGLLDYRGSYDASTNLFPATGGSGLAGAILKGDFWICSVPGTLGGVAVTAGDLIIALQDTPGQTAGNWDLVSNELGYTPANNALSNLGTVAINTSLVSDTNNTDDLGSTGVRWKKSWVVDAESTNMPTVGGTSLASTFAPIASPTFTGTVTTPAIKITTGAGAGKVFTSDADGDGTWETPSGGTVIPKVTWNYIFSGTTPGSTDSNESVNESVTGGGTATYGNVGADVATSATITSGVLLTITLSTSTKVDMYAGSPSFAVGMRYGGTVGTDVNILVGIGTSNNSGGAITYTVNHIGFKIVRASSGNSNLYATQANGTTETASSSLTTLVANDFVDLILQVNGTSSVDYYWRKNGGALSSATNLTTNIPNTTTDNKIGFKITNVGVATDTGVNLASMTYSR